MKSIKILCAFALLSITACQNDDSSEISQENSGISQENSRNLTLSKRKLAETDVYYVTSSNKTPENSTLVKDNVDETALKNLIAKDPFVLILGSDVNINFINTFNESLKAIAEDKNVVITLSNHESIAKSFFNIEKMSMKYSSMTSESEESSTGKVSSPKLSNSEILINLSGFFLPKDDLTQRYECFGQNDENITIEKAVKWAEQTLKENKDTFNTNKLTATTIVPKFNLILTRDVTFTSPYEGGRATYRSKWYHTTTGEKDGHIYLFKGDYQQEPGINLYKGNLYNNNWMKIAVQLKYEYLKQNFISNLVAHEPRNATEGTSSTTVGFKAGGGLSMSGPSLSAEYSMGWTYSQPDISRWDFSSYSSRKAYWKWDIKNGTPAGKSTLTLNPGATFEYTGRKNYNLDGDLFVEYYGSGFKRVKKSLGGVGLDDITYTNFWLTTDKINGYPTWFTN